MSVAAGSWVRFGLIALLALALGALLLFSASPVWAQAVDYDTDGDNLIEVSNLAQLNAIRWDLDGNGASTNAGYALAFLTPAASMGCAATCTGYELTTDLDFDTDSSGAVDSSDTYASWSPIGTSASPFVATFDGGGHTILKMTIRASGSNVGLFGSTSTAAIIRNLALLAVDIDRATGRPRTDAVGAIVGFNRGRIERSYATGSAQGVERVGGLAGDNQGTIANSYANVTAGGSRYVGGLAGRNHGSAASITNSYSIGSQSAKSMMYSTGRGGFDSGIVGSEGGIVGANTGSATISASYWNSQTSSSPWSYAGIFPDNLKKTTAQLQSPTGATGIYVAWSAAIWDFGTSSQYPALLYDTDGDSTPSAYEFGGQGRSLPTDYDSDDNGLIEVDSLAKLNAIRYDLDGNGAPAAANANDYALAFPTPAVGMGCPVTATDADDNDCLGYELTADLDFNTDTTGSSAAVIDSSDDYWDGGLGWSPIASESTAYMAVFDGGRHTIANLFINRPTSNMVNTRDANKSNYVGLFASLMSPGEVRHLRLTGVSVTGRGNVGAVVGHITQGTVSNVSSTGAVTAVGSSGGDGEKAGGLVGSAGSASALIEYSYSTATVTAGDDYAGGLIGESKGEILASYATGAATATGNYAGGLAGSADYNSSIIVSYATGAASGADYVGGLVGRANGDIAYSYSRGAASSTSSPVGTNVGGLVGSQVGTIIASYWDVTTSGIADDSDAATGEGMTTSDLQTPQAYGSGAAIYSAWNVDVDNADGDSTTTTGADDPWDFGTASQYPALKADFNGDGVKSAADGDFGRQPRSAPVVNNSPAFSDAALSASIDENVHAGRNVGNLMTANDRDGDTLVYSLTGADGVYFAIDPSSAQIKSKFVLDYESKSSYVFQVKAVDPSGGEATMEVTVYVSDESEGATDSVDYDIDSDGLIEVDSLDQLDAMRHDLDGDGVSTNAAYFSNDFTTPAAGMGCPVADHDSDAGTPDQPTCTGYELTADLDFNTDKTGSSAAVVDSSDAYWNGGAGWAPIGSDASASTQYSATFDGDGHTISNLFISRSSTDDVGLFGAASATSAVRNVGLVDVAVTGSDYTGALIGTAYGAVDSVYSTGSVTGSGDVGGLMGYMNSGGTMQRSYSTASVTGSGDDIGGLVGNNIGTLTASYATGAVTGVDYVGGLVGANSRALNSSDSGSIIASYATGEVSGTGSDVGGLVGVNAGTITNSYWDVTTSTQADDGNAATGVGKTTSQLQSPTQTNGYAGIYANWNLNLDSTAGGDDPWDFGTASEYPALKVEWDGDGTPSAYEFGRQGRAAPAVAVDYDLDDDGLIEVSDLAQLNAMRWDLNGDGASTDAGYATAFPNPETGMGCPITAADADDNDCLGYELTANLDFDTNGSGTANLGDTYWNGGSGWEPIGTSASRFNTVFDGRGYTISNLFISRGATDYVGLFGAAGAWIRARNVGLEDAAVTGQDNVGILLGETNGEVEFTYTTGSVVGRVRVGGLVGNSGRTGSIETSYSTASVTGTGNYSGGLIGQSNGAVKASYATGAVGGVRAGGLVGRNYYYGAITASYARGAVTGSSVARGLVASNPILFGLPGQPDDTGTVTDSYWDVTTSGIADDNDAATGVGRTTNDLATPEQSDGYAGIYANWNLNLDSTAGGDDPWDFGTASQYPALKADFNRDSVKSAADGDFGRQPRAAPVVAVDYDLDDNNLIEVSTLAQLNAIRHDLDGNGDSTHADYTGAFLNAAADMGCAATCTGYELTADLDFDTNGSGTANAGDTYYNGGDGWAPIGSDSSAATRYNAVFDGNGHTISNLFISRNSTSDLGLFGSSSATSAIRNVGLESANVTGQNYTGALIGSAFGAVDFAYSTGSVNGSDYVGGLVGYFEGEIQRSYSTAGVTGSDYVGGLVGNATNTVVIKAGYATGAVSGRIGVGGLVGSSDGDITASYSTGAVTGTGSNVGGLVGNSSGGTITNSYWNTDTSSQTTSSGGVGKTTNDLATPEQSDGYAGIYANWNLNLDSTAGGDDPWDFGTASQYPALKADFNDDGVKSAVDGDFGRQPRSAPVVTVDYDTDNDGLIEVDSLDKLNAIRWDLNGDGASTNAGYATAFPNPAASMGCASNTCTGYELTADLDFDQSNDNAITSDDAAWWNGGAGWAPIGTWGSPFNATFDGGGHAISHLYIRRSGSNVGLFGSAGTAAVIRNVGLENVDIDRSTGDPVFSSIAGLVGSNRGAVALSYSTGAVTGHENVGGLVGDNRGAVTNSYSSVTVTGNKAVGGLAGFNRSSSASITNSYAAGAVSAVSMQAGPAWNAARTKGGLVGETTSDATVTASYWDTQTSSQAASAGGTGQTTSGLQSPTGAAGIYGAWAAAIWDFGTASEYPALKYDTNENGLATWQEFGRQARSAPAQLVDYDRDDDGLIDVDSLAKLHAVRWDLDGNGASTNAGYALAFPNPETGMGCPVTTTDADDNDCTGYELTADLDFDTHGNDDTVTAADAAYWNGGAGWAPIGSSSAPFAATFDGAGHAIANLFINRGSTDYIGLFRVVGDGGRIRNLGLERVNITGRDFIGAVAGEMSAFSGVEAVYVTGAVSGRDLIGGLIGEHHPNASLRNTYSAARVTGSSYVGGLLGYVPSSNATVYYSYARGVVTGRNSGGLLYPSADQYGINGQQTYWDTLTSGQATSNGGTGQTTGNLKSPTGASGIYSNWPTATWDFGTAIQYPALKYDTDGDGAASWQEFGRQPRSAANAAPTFDAADTTPTVAEGARLVGSYPASDPDGDPLTYGKSGADATAFDISGAGALSLDSAADHERKSSYRVTLRVRDSKDADGHPDAAWDDSIDLIVGVDDDTSESPGAPAGLTANPIAEGLRVTWIAPVRTDQPPVTGYGVEYKLSTATAWTSHPHTRTGTDTQITGLTSGATYNVRVRALSHENPSGWTSANGVQAAAWQRMDYDTDDDGLIEINYLDQLNAMRWDEDGDGAGGGSDYDAAFPDAAPGMGCPSGCTGYELEADLNFDTNGRVGADSGDDYWNGGRGWAPFRYYGIFEGNRHTISNLYVNRPDSDYVGLFSTAGAYAEVSEVRNLGLENVDVTGREYAGGLAGRAYGSVRRVYTTGEVMGEKMVGGLVGEARGLISETYSKADVSGDGWESSNVGGLVGYLRLGTVKASYATGDVSAVTWVGGLVGHNSSSDDGGIIASYATGNLGFGGLEDADPPPGRWVDGFSSRYYLPYTPTWVGGLVGDSSGPVVASYSTGGHPISLAGFQPGERKDRSRRDLAYMMEVHWKVGGLIGKSYGRQEYDSYWDIVTSKHRPGDDPDWVYGEGKTTEELQSVTGYTGIYANWDVDLDGDGIGDDPWDFGSSAHYPTLKVDWDGDGTATAYEFGGQGRSLNDHVPSVAVGGTGVYEVTVPENTPSGAPIFGVTLPLAPADDLAYSVFRDPEWPDGAHFDIDTFTGQLSTKGALDYESKDTYRLRITAVRPGVPSDTWPSTGIIIRVTDVAEPPGPPTGVTIVPHKGSLEVSWTAPDMTGKPPLRIYEVTYYHDGDKAKITAAGTTTYTMTHLTPLITYAVRVRARNVDGWGPDSAVAYGTPYWFAPAAAATGAEPGTQRFRRSAPQPGQPANLRATPQEDGSTLVTWDAPTEAEDDTFYRVRRRVDAADSSYQVIARRVEAADSDGVVAYRDEGSGREAGQRYLYSARAFDGDGKPLGQWTQGVRDNRPPAFAGDSAAAFQVAENTAAGTDIGSPVTAADPDDGDSLVYLLGGADADHFAIDPDSGQLRTSGALDYESQDSYAVTVIAADGAGLWAGLDVTITVTDVKEAPGQPDAPEIINIKQTSFRVTWTAPAAGSSAITGYGIQYKLSSEADSAYADAKPTKRGTVTGYNLVDRSGQSITAGTSYDVRVRAKNAEGWGAWSDAATAVTASPDPSDTTPGQPDAPEISNIKQTSFRITWTAPAAGSSAITGYGIQYKLSSEADSAYADAKPTKRGTVTGYNLVDRSGQSITAGTSYDVRVRAKNAEGWGAWSDAATAVTASPDPSDTTPGQPDAPEISNIKQTSFRITWTAPAAGSSAITGYGIQYKLSSEADSAYADAKPTKRGTVTGYNVVDRNSQAITAGASYDVRVRAKNAEGWGPWSDPATAVTASPAPPPNNPPSFASSTLEVSVAENTAAGANIGDAIEATDPDAGDTLTYTLGTTTDDAHFTIDSQTGQLQTSGALDYENQSSYAVTVTATDGGGLTASIAVTVKVDDVADTTPGQPDAPEISNVKQTSFRITWTAPAAGSSAISGYGIQYKLSSEADSAYADAKPTKRGTVTGYNLVDRRGQSITAGTSYDVRVRARNAEGWGEWSEAATAVTASPDPPPDAAPANGDEAEADDSGQEESADAAGSYQATAYFVQGRVWLEWDDVDGAKRYTVQKNGQLMPGWFIATAFFDGDVEETTRYEYRITAYDGEDNVLAVMTAATGA